MKKLLSAITMLAMSAAAMAQSYVVYEWKDSVPAIRNISDVDSITYSLSENLVRLTTGSPIKVKKTSMVSDFELASKISFADPSITEQGICYSLSNANPTIGDEKVIFGTFQKGVCQVTITGLVNNTFYYYRPYFVVADCVYYGPVKTFSTWEGADSSNPAILETLNTMGSFKSYLRLLSDPDVNPTATRNSSFADALSAPGTKTLFVASDEAWDAFFENNKRLPKSNPWHYAQSYEKLSKSQKRLLFHSSILHQAIAVDQLSSTSGEDPVSGTLLRRYTDVETLDSVARVAVTDLPMSYWSADRQTTEEAAAAPETDQWGRIRNGGLLGYDSIYVLQDGSVPMMVHITPEYMKNHKITEEDLRVILGHSASDGNVHIDGACVDRSDILCENGYINMMSNPLAPLANMAELIRTNGRTNIYSHLLERFSVPFQNKELGSMYAKLNPKFLEVDTLYAKRYYSMRSYGSTANENKALNYGESGNYANASLVYDPGWNGYFPLGQTAECDMGAMFVPNDEQMLMFFNQGAGRLFLEQYTLNHRAGQYSINDLELLYQDIDQIPLRVVAAILNHGMFDSFAQSVPSKMYKLRKGNTERIFSERDTRLTKDGGTIDTVMLACNGAVYVMDNVFTPSDFNCVATPAYLGSDCNIMRWAIYSDQEGQGFMGMDYYAYLKVMENQLSFFMPNDTALEYYYDPMSFTSRFPRVMRFMYTTGNFPIYLGRAVLAKFDVTTGTIGNDLITEHTNKTEIINRLRQMLEHNTVAHENGINAINTEEDQYYLSKNGMGIKVTRGAEGVIYAQGGFQLENEREGLADNHPGILRCNVAEKGEYKNGWTFTLDAPMIPAARSVFSVLSNIQRGQKGEPADYSNEETINSNPYYEFFRLCNEIDENLIIKSGLVDENDPKYDISTPTGERALLAAIDKYRTFIDNNAVDYNVRFFSNYNYTVFVPTNEAVKAAIAKGLPTWESIYEDFYNCANEDGCLTNAQDSARIQAKIIYLTNFIRTHFADKSIFADKSELATDLSTNSYNRDYGTFGKVYVQRVKTGGETNLMVKDNTAEAKWISTVSSTSDGRDVKNIMTCDRECNSRVKDQSMNGKTVISSSYSVIHLINGVLNHDALNADGTYPKFNDSNAARQYVKRFAIR